MVLLHNTGYFSLSLSLFIKNSNLVYINKPFVSNLICYCEFTKYLLYNSHFSSDNISALP
jgi:coproporphyrinogen III oxidase-like Fe-S oxidoreductase